jgi:hypothetical protein
LASPVSSTPIRQLLSSYNRETSDHQDKNLIFLYLPLI